MLYTTQKVLSIEDVNIGDIFWIELKLGFITNANNITILAIVLAKQNNSNRVEVEFLNSDRSSIWVDLDRLYFTSNKQGIGFLENSR